MQGAPKRQVKAEEMLAELKRALESSARAPNAPPPPASTAPRSGSPDRESRRSQIDGDGGPRPAKATAIRSIGPRTDLRKPGKPRSRSWKLTAGGLALAGVAAVCASVAFLNKAPDLLDHEPSVAATESLARPENQQAPEPSSESRAAAPAPTPAPLNQAAALVTSHRIGPDGAPLVTTPPAPASTDAAPPPAEAPKTAAAPAASQMARPDGAPLATTPPAPASANSAPPPAETPKPNAKPTASLSNEPAEASTPKIDSKKKPSGKPSPQKPRTTAKASAKAPAQAERQSAEPAPPKEAERSGQPAQAAGNPTPLAPVPAPSVQQRVTDGMSHAFSYLVHLPGALVPHLGGPTPDAH
jgi:hypothetical protein